MSVFNVVANIVANINNNQNNRNNNNNNLQINKISTQNTQVWYCINIDIFGII